jgi:hypothetical protein
MAVILLVEDEEQVRVLAESYLEGLGHQVLSAGTPQGAIALLQKNQHVDLLFTGLERRHPCWHRAGDVVCRGAREDAVGKKDKRSKKAKKLAREVKKEAKKEKKKSNTEIDRSDVKPPSPFPS